MVSVPSHNWVIATPDGLVTVTVHAVVAALPVLVTFTCAWNPPCHELVVVYVALHDRPVPPDDGLIDGPVEAGRLGEMLTAGLDGRLLDGGALDGGALAGVVPPELPLVVYVAWVYAALHWLEQAAGRVRL